MQIILILLLYFLLLKVIIFGYLASYLYVDIASYLLTYSLFTYPNQVGLVKGHIGVTLIIKVFPIIITIVASFTAIYLYYS